MTILAHLAFSEVKDDRWYLSLFKEATSQDAIGEITPAYSALPELGVKHIKSLLGDIKSIRSVNWGKKRKSTGSVL